MIPMTLAEVAAAVGGTVAGEETVPTTGPTTGPITGQITGPATVDSRAVEPGGLFVAVRGEHADGHDFAEQAVAAGAAAVLGSRPTGVPTVVVTDPVAALGRLARHVLDRLPDLRVLALTGSQGKTGTKDLLAQVLEQHGPTVATSGNHNNEIGVPLTALRAGTDTRFLVVEMGARGTGHIAYLCGIAPPESAAVLNVGSAHVGEFGSRSAIATAKREILEQLPASGTAVLNADDDLVAAMAPHTPARVLTFGEGAASDLCYTDLTTDELGRPRATLGYAGHTASVRLRLVGRHQMQNAAAAAALATAVELDLETIARALETATNRSSWRMDLQERPDRTLVLNDSYNANPESMRAALASLADLGRARGARTIAVLGEMKELGAEAEEAHRQLGSAVVEAGVDVLVGVGAVAPLLGQGVSAATGGAVTVVSVADPVEALAWLRGNVAAGDAVLVKASRGVALERVAEGLLAQDERAEGRR